jgi:hypothetical protein
VTEKIIVSGWAADVVITEQDWASLEAMGGVALSHEARNAVRAAIARYVDSISLYRESSRASEVARVLVEIAAKAKELAATLGKLRDGVAEAAQDRIDLIARRNWRGLYSIAAVQKTVLRLATDASAAVGGLPQSDLGGDGDPYLGKLLVELLTAYHSAGGKGRYTASAVRFLRRAASLAGAQIQSEPAMKKRLQRALDRSQPNNPDKRTMT